MGRRGIVVVVAGVNRDFERLDGVLIAVDVNGSGIRDTRSWGAESGVLLSNVLGLRVRGEGESRDMYAGIS